MDNLPKSRGMIWTGLVIAILSMVVAFWKETPQVVKSVTELVKVFHPTPSDPLKIPIPQGDQELARIVGTWRSDTSGKMYEVTPQSLNAFTFSEIIDGRSVPAGVGVIINNNISIEYTSPTKGRLAVLTLSVSEDGNMMFGSMQGKDLSETGLLRFRKVAVG